MSLMLPWAGIVGSDRSVVVPTVAVEVSCIAMTSLVALVDTLRMLSASEPLLVTVR